MLPLKGFRILDLSRHGPGGFATLLLADLGSSVVKIEQPGTGDLLRSVPPIVKGVSAYFVGINRNKQSVTLDLKHPAGKEILFKLAERSDALVESFRPGVVSKLGIDYESMRKINRRLVYCSLSGYGQNGPYRSKVGHDLNYIGRCGMLDLMGNIKSVPFIPGVVIADFGGGSMMAAIGMLAGYISSQRTGEGQYIDVSLMDGAFSWLQGQVSVYSLTGNVPRRGGGYSMVDMHVTAFMKQKMASSLL